MKWSDRGCVWGNAQRTVSLLAVIACCGAIPQLALADQVQAYVIFEIAPSTDESVAAEKLRSASLGNCLQLLVGRHGRDVFVHIACDERGTLGDRSFLNQAFLELSRVDGIARATIVSLKHGTE
jgi:hypothetical protein